MHWADQKLIDNLRKKHGKLLSGYTDDELHDKFLSFMNNSVNLGKGGLSDEAFMLSLPYLGMKVKFYVVYDTAEDFEYKIGEIVLWSLLPIPVWKLNDNDVEYIDSYVFEPVCYARYLNRWGYPAFIRLGGYPRGQQICYVDDEENRIY
jgi:hypothetical protein